LELVIDVEAGFTVLLKLLQHLQSTLAINFLDVESIGQDVECGCLLRFEIIYTVKLVQRHTLGFVECRTGQIFRCHGLKWNIFQEGRYVNLIGWFAHSPLLGARLHRRNSHMRR